MAKELPFFKFEPNQWDNGNIQICTREQKGVFIDLCSMYWSRLGDVSYKLAVQKLCGGNASALDSLYDNKIIDIIDGNIYIKFLSEQLSDFEDISKKNSHNAKEGWIKRRLLKNKSESNAGALPPQSDPNAIREEEKREEEIIKDNKFNFKTELLNYGFAKNLVDDWILVRKTKKATNTETALKSFITEIEKRPCDKNEVLKKIVTNNWSGFSWKWLDNSEQKTPQQQSSEPKSRYKVHG